MPLINGMKMACEPCIRGHRSTKCNHANERLMVPVRKPGRPLSACPHLKDYACGCSNVTAAILRKQTCRCNSAVITKDNGLSRATTSSSVDSSTSPSKPSFRIDKTYQRTNLSRNPSTIANMNRMSTCQANRNQILTNGHESPLISSDYENAHIADEPERHSQTSVPPAFSAFSSGKDTQENENSQNCNGNFENAPSYNLNQNALTRARYSNNREMNTKRKSRHPDIEISDMINVVNGSRDERTSCCVSYKNSHVAGERSAVVSAFSSTDQGINCDKITDISEGTSCSVPRRMNHSHISSLDSSTEIGEAKMNHSYSSETSNIQNSDSIVSHIESQITPPNNVAFRPQLFSYPSSHQNMFSYMPTTYGSFSNPLDVSIWRQTQQNAFSYPPDMYTSYTNSMDASALDQNQGTLFSHSQIQNEPLSTYTTTTFPEVRSFTTNCNCGETCQCVGCISHPYNDATKDYVRSAWQIVSMENASSTSLNNVSKTTENETLPLQQNLENGSSPNPPTPSSLSANGEEQSLSENDFLFVNYSFPLNCCTGSDVNYLCGADCQCLECGIQKRNPG
ncbi:putative copper fist dna binding domain-containing protein [Golovinomyces cichoracearum]|uniref:Putative copper fist dna binding domain-containing protein n=1 Tax=Golovinomyces cichoracearum TaxID=62708 RepID=A0A420IS44_9PEZI|nr:putative copper fist dna binding domain-containing protein [Golovinomyces cichoracearum]